MKLQPPTAQHLRIRSIHDAHKLFHAVYMRMLPMVVRRLDAEERKMIKSGDVHVWEERGPGTEATGLGIERWTDGRLWGPSRVRDCFLFYHEKDREPEDFHGGSKWARMLSGGVVVFRRRSEGPLDQPGDHHTSASSSPLSSSPPSTSPSSPPGGLGVLDVSEHPDAYVHNAYGEPKERLVKQTYSVLVHLPPEQAGEEGTGIRKWHMTAYFSSSQKSQQTLRTVDDIPTIGSLQVPEGMYEPARAGRGVGTNGGGGRLRSTSASASTKSVLVPPLPASMKNTWHHHHYPPHHHHHLMHFDEHPQGHRAAGGGGGSGSPSSTYARYTPYQHRSTPASPTVEYDHYPFVVPSQNGPSSPTAAPSTSPPNNHLPPLQFGGSSTTTPEGGRERLRPLSTISTITTTSTTSGSLSRSRSRSRSSSTSTSSTSLSSTMSPPTPSHFPPLSPLSPLSLTPKSDVPPSNNGSVETISLVPLSFLEGVRHNLSQPLAWSSPNARRAVDEEVVRGLDLRPVL